MTSGLSWNRSCYRAIDLLIVPRLSSLFLWVVFNLHESLNFSGPQLVKMKLLHLTFENALTRCAPLGKGFYLTLWKNLHFFFYLRPKDVTFLATIQWLAASLIFGLDDFDNWEYGGSPGTLMGRGTELGASFLVSGSVGCRRGPQGHLDVSLILSTPGIMQCLFEP